MNYYDIQYLTLKIPSTEFLNYLGWRRAFLETQSTRVYDEFDLSRAYLKIQAQGGLMIGGRVPDQFIGYDGEFEKESLKRVTDRVTLPEERM